MYSLSTWYITWQLSRLAEPTAQHNTKAPPSVTVNGLVVYTFGYHSVLQGKEPGIVPYLTHLHNLHNYELWIVLNHGMYSSTLPQQLHLRKLRVSWANHTQYVSATFVEYTLSEKMLHTGAYERVSPVFGWGQLVSVSSCEAANLSHVGIYAVLSLCW